MKKKWIFVSIVAVLFAAGGAYAGPVSLKVDKDTDSDKIRDRVINAHYTQLTVGEKETCTLEITVGNKAETETTCQLEWYFLSDHKDSSEKRGSTIIYKSGVKELTLDIGAKVKETIESPLFVFRKITGDFSIEGRTTSSKQTTEGDKYEGYVVLVRVDGKIVASESNSSRYLKDEWMSKYKPGAGKTGGSRRR